MINVNDITEKLSLPKFDLPKLGMPKIDLTNLELDKVKLPKFDLPKFDLPKVERPNVELPKVDVSRVTDFARDAAYVGVGAVVLSVQTVTGQVTDRFRKVVGATT